MNGRHQTSPSGNHWRQDTPIASFMAGPNPTRGRGGSGAQRSDVDWVRAIRRGVRHDGTSLIVMPSEVFTHLAESDLPWSIFGTMSDADLHALWRYLQSVPAKAFGNKQVSSTP